MAFYAKKCEKCLERSKRVVKETRHKDGNGIYTVKYYECDSHTCDIAVRATRSKKKYDREIKENE